LSPCVQVSDLEAELDSWLARLRTVRALSGHRGAVDLHLNEATTGGANDAAELSQVENGVTWHSAVTCMLTVDSIARLLGTLHAYLQYGLRACFSPYYAAVPRWTAGLQSRNAWLSSGQRLSSAGRRASGAARLTRSCGKPRRHSRPPWPRSSLAAAARAPTSAARGVTQRAVGLPHPLPGAATGTAEADGGHAWRQRVQMMKTLPPLPPLLRRHRHCRERR